MSPAADVHPADPLAREVEARWGGDAAAWDAAQRLPAEVIAWCAERGAFGAAIPREYGGGGWSAAEVGRIFEALGAVSGSLGSAVNVTHMVARTLARWASPGQCRRWLPGIATGEVRAAICLTEPDNGSDLSAVGTRWDEDPGGGGRLVGTKTWITCGQDADAYLVLARHAAGPALYLVDRHAPGVRVEPIPDMLGLRSAGLATVHLEGVRVGPEAEVGRPGIGLLLVSEGLMHGRVNLAWMAAGLLREALARTVRWASTRRVFGEPLLAMGQTRQALARARVDLRAARALCRAAGEAVESGAPGAMDAALAAKYFACRAAAEHSGVALRLHGARGCHEPSDLPRFLRDARVFEIIEGSSELIESLLADGAARDAVAG